MNNIQKDVDLLVKVNSVDIQALEDAKCTLQVIKETDPGVYDEIIDESLKLIHQALELSCVDALDRIADQLGVQA